MERIKAPQSVIYSRGKNVQNLLKPISKRKEGPAWSPKSIRETYIIGTHEGSPPTSEYTKWRFATTNKLFRACYFEEWKRTSDDLFCLHRAYLSIYKKNLKPNSEDEYLLLHCDPDEPDDAPHALYKKGPHFHIEVAPNPIHKSHIGLCLSNIDHALSSIDAFTDALKPCVLMIREQFLDLSD